MRYYNTPQFSLYCYIFFYNTNILYSIRHNSMWQYFQALKGQPVEENENNAQAQPTEIQGMEEEGLEERRE